MIHLNEALISSHTRLQNEELNFLVTPKSRDKFKRKRLRDLKEGDKLYFWMADTDQNTIEDCIVIAQRKLSGGPLDDGQECVTWVVQNPASGEEYDIYYYKDNIDDFTCTDDREGWIVTTDIQDLIRFMK